MGNCCWPGKLPYAEGVCEREASSWVRLAGIVELGVYVVEGGFANCWPGCGVAFCDAPFCWKLLTSKPSRGLLLL